ncbi:MAG: DUF6220 domain-containing protein [Dehalococcoidia bacterium]
MQRTTAWIYTTIAWITVAGLLLQFYAAGMALFGTTTFEFHRSLGFALQLPALALLIAALAGRMGRQVIGLSALLVVLTFVQGLLPVFRDDASLIAALHPVGGLVLLGLTWLCARQGRAVAVARGAEQKTDAGALSERLTS